MAILPIVTYPDERLRATTKNVTEFGPAIARLCSDLIDTMMALDGVGIAANQTGEAVRLFVLNCVPVATWEARPGVQLYQLGAASEFAAQAGPMIFCNPVLLFQDESKEEGQEGCLSFPGISVWIDRPVTVRLAAQDAYGTPFEAEGTGLWARAIMHEMDHLNGILLVDHVGPLKKQSIKKKMAKLKRR